MNVIDRTLTQILIDYEVAVPGPRPPAPVAPPIENWAGDNAAEEAVAALAEQGRVHHTQRAACLADVDVDTGVITWRDPSPHDPHLADLEDQLCALTPDFDRATGSPDRADAMVYAVSELCPVVDVPEPAKPPVPLDPFDAMVQRLEQRAAYDDLDMDPGEET
jgi:hypothetical protein